MLKQPKQETCLKLSIPAPKPQLVLLVMKAMFAYPEATFLDLGSNIGMFTVAVAAMGRKVKAVDAGFENHAYTRTSLQLASNLHNVDLIYNGLSDKHETLYPVDDYKEILCDISYNIL